MWQMWDGAIIQANWIIWRASPIWQTPIYFLVIFWPLSPLWKPQREDLGQSRGAAILGPHLRAVTALWKYHLFPAARRAWPSHRLYLNSEETTACRLTIPEETASLHTALFGLFLLYTFWFGMDYIFCTRCSACAPNEQRRFYRSTYLHPCFLHDLLNGTIEVIWFSSLFKIPAEIQCLTTLTHSLVLPHPAPAQTWSKYRRVPHEGNNTYPGLFASGM